MHYDQVPHTIEEWQELTGAMIVVNGGFFSGRNTPVGRIVSDGTLYGFPLIYEEDSIGVPGLFAIVDGEPAIYSMGRSPFSPRGLRFDAAVECYPMLLLPGSQPGFERETGMLARRTAVGVDEHGNIIILFVDAPMFSLHRFARWLAGADLGLDSVLNLDGGRSSGIAVGLGEGRVIPSVVPLPIILAVYPR